MSIRSTGIDVLAMLGVGALTAPYCAAARLEPKGSPKDGLPVQIAWEGGPAGGALARPVTVQVVRWNDGEVFRLAFTRDGGASPSWVPTPLCVRPLSAVPYLLEFADAVLGMKNCSRL